MCTQPSRVSAVVRALVKGSARATRMSRAAGVVSLPWLTEGCSDVREAPDGEEVPEEADACKLRQVR